MTFREDATSNQILTLQSAVHLKCPRFSIEVRSQSQKRC